MKTFTVFFVAFGLMVFTTADLQAQGNSHKQKGQGAKGKKERVYVQQKKHGNPQIHKSNGRAHGGIVYTRPHPPKRVYVRPHQPGPDYFWVEPHWGWSEYSGQYYWVNGAWTPLRSGYRYTPGSWVNVAGGGSQYTLGVWIRM